MNLVIDDAVEVKQITKDNTEEKRRPLGKKSTYHVTRIFFGRGRQY